MAQKMTWEEMKAKYPDEWLLIVDFEISETGRLISGCVERHSKSKSEVYRLPRVGKDAVFEYTGEGNFPGGLRAHAQCYHV